MALTNNFLQADPFAKRKATNTFSGVANGTEKSPFEVAPMAPPPAPVQPAPQAVQPPVIQPPPQQPQQAVPILQPKTTTAGLLSPATAGDKPFDVQDTELFKASQKATLEQLAGETPGFEAQATEGREAMKQAQAQRAKSIREGLVGSGFRDTGRFLEEGIIAPEQQTMAERAEFERGLIADRAAKSREQVIQGQAAAQNLIGLLQSGELTQQELAQQEKLLEKSLASQENIALLNIEGQTELTKLQDKLNTGQLMAKQDFAKMTQQLANDHDLAVQAGNFDQAEKIAKLQQSFNLITLQKEQEFTKAMNTANNAWKTTAQLTDIQANNAAQALEIAARQAEQDKDILAQENIAGLQAKLQLKLQTQGFTHQEKMEYLDSQLTETASQNQFARQLQALASEQGHEAAMVNLQATLQATAETTAFARQLQVIASNQGHEAGLLEIQAKLSEAQAVNDFGRVKELEALKDSYEDDNLDAVFEKEKELQQIANDFQSGQLDKQMDHEFQIVEFKAQTQFDLLKKEQGHDIAMTNLNGDIQKALQDNNAGHAAALEKMKFQNEQYFFQQNIEIKKLELALKEEGVDMAKLEQEYNFIQNEIAAGRLDASAAVDFLSGNLPEGVDYKPPDPKATQMALEEDYLTQQMQWAITQEGGLEAVGEFDEESGQFLGLKDVYAQQFNEHLNETLYNEAEGPTAALIDDLQSGEKDISYFNGKTAEDPIYKALLNDVKTKTWSDETVEVGFGSSSRIIFTNMPAVGGFLKRNGVLFQLSSKKTEDRAGDDWKLYKLTNALTGESFWISTEGVDIKTSFDKNS